MHRPAGAVSGHDVRNNRACRWPDIFHYVPELAVCGGALAPPPVYDLVQPDHAFPRCPGDGAYPRNGLCDSGGRTGVAEPDAPCAPLGGIHWAHQLPTVSLALAVAGVCADPLV